MSVQSSQGCVAAMQSATTSREPTAASVLGDTSLRQMGGLVLVSFVFLKSIAHQPLGCDPSHGDRKHCFMICAHF